MSERVERLPSKIVQYDDYNNVALCEDGSVWEYFRTRKWWAQIHPPHQPPTQSADLAEALSVLRRLVVHACVDSGHDAAKSVEAFVDARALLKKHGA